MGYWKAEAPVEWQETVDGPLVGRTFLWDQGDKCWRIEVEWAIASGRAEPIRVSVLSASEPPLPMRAEVLNRLPLGRIVARMRAEIRSVAARWRDRDLSRYPSGAGVRGTVELAQVERGARRGKRVTDADLLAVARAYKDAADDGRPVTQAVADALRVSRSTAGKYIMRARRTPGLLDGYSVKSR